MNTQKAKNQIVRLAVISIGLCLFNYGAVRSADPLFDGVYGSETFTGSEAVQTWNIDAGDYDSDGLHDYTAVLPADGIRQLFYLPHRPLHRLISVKVDGVLLDPRDSTTRVSNYSYHPKNGWITFQQKYTAGQKIEVTYKYSTDLDIAATHDSASATNHNNVIYRNERNGNFTEDKIDVTLPDHAGVNQTDEVRKWSIAFGDFNKDSNIDLVNGAWNGNSYVYINDGIAPFYEKKVLLNQLQFMKHSDIVMGDYDSDGDLDIAASQLKSYVNFRNPPKPYPLFTYQYHFDDENGYPVIMGGWMHYNDRETSGIEFGDFDLDGDLDLLSLEYSSITSKIHVWENHQTNQEFLYLTTPWAAGVKKISLQSNNQVASIGRKFSKGNYGMNEPNGICVDSQFIYIADTDNRRMVKLNKSNFSYDSETDFDASTTGISVTPYGVAEHNAFLYVTYIGSNKKHGVKKLNTNDLTVVTTIEGDPGNNPGQFDNPMGIDVAANSAYANQDIVFVADMLNNRIQLFDVNLIFQGASNAAGTLFQPTDIVVDSDPGNNKIYITNAGASLDLLNENAGDQDCVVMCNIDFSGIPVVIGGASEGLGNDEFNEPMGITMDNNCVYITDTGNNRINVRNKDAAFSFKENVSVHRFPTGIDYDEYQDLPTERDFTEIWKSGVDRVYGNAECADFDNDGDLDFVATHNKGWEVWRNDGGFSFTRVIDDATLQRVTGVSVYDVNKDGLIDFAVGVDGSYNPDSGAIYYENQYDYKTSSFKFEKKWESNETTGDFNEFDGYDVNLADLDGDGNVDLTTSAYGTKKYHGIVVFGAPTGHNVKKIEAIVNGTTVIKYFKINANGSLGDLISTEVK